MKKENETKQVVADIEPVVLKVRKIAVNQFSLAGKFIKTFESQHEASKETNTNYVMLNKSLNGKAKSAGGFQWRKADN